MVYSLSVYPFSKGSTLPKRRKKTCYCGNVFVLPFSQGALEMESVSHFMALYCLIEQAAFENPCSDPDFLLLLAFAPLECRPDMQHCEYKQNLGNCCEFPNTAKRTKSIPEYSEDHGTHLYSVERKLVYWL